jgi:hypothetical protein
VPCSHDPIAYTVRVEFDAIGQFGPAPSFQTARSRLGLGQFDTVTGPAILGVTVLITSRRRGLDPGDASTTPAIRSVAYGERVGANIRAAVMWR